MPSPYSQEEISIPVRAVRRTVAVVAIVGVLVLVALILWQQRDRIGSAFDRGIASRIDQSAYQAVFLADGQVYFGKLSTGDGYLLLHDVFYLPQQEPQANEGQLIKRGNELHGPREPMIVPASEVLFIENLRDDAPVVSAIRRYHSGAPGATAPPPPPRPSTARPATPSPTAAR